MRMRELAQENLRHVSSASRARRELAERFDLCSLVYLSSQMHEVVSLAVRVAASDVPILITGPNGSGKERLAEIIQKNSRRRSGPFVKVNAGGLPDQLLEAELFGAEAGAYTGATKTRIGRFEEAHKGTLFLDEIGNLPPAGQMKLLRVLETGRFERLGSNKERQVKVRVLSATNADLPAMIRAGSFREDLFYRLNLIELRLPPLAARPADIVPLATSFLAGAKRLHASAQAALLAHGWPGNVRELKNVMARAALLAAGEQIMVADLGLPAPPCAAPEAEPDRGAIDQALARSGGVVAQAAVELGLSRQALYRRMDRLGIARS